MLPASPIRWGTSHSSWSGSQRRARHRHSHRHQAQASEWGRRRLAPGPCKYGLLPAAFATLYGCSMMPAPTLRIPEIGTCHLQLSSGPPAKTSSLGASGCVTGILERQAPASYRVPYVQHLRPVISMSPKLSTRWPKWSLRGLSWLVYRCLPRLRLPQQLQQAQH